MKIIPTYLFSDIFNIDYDLLLNNNIKYLFFDIDNTLIPYHENKLTDKHLLLFKSLVTKGFILGIISNNSKRRIKDIDNEYFQYKLYKVRKPNINYFMKFITLNKLNKENTIIIGDQLVTDIRFANKLGIKSILVKTIDVKNQKWYTKINRLREKRIIKKLPSPIQKIMKEWY